MSGKGGYDWGTIDFENDYLLSKSHWDKLRALIKVDYARQPLKDVKPENRDLLSGLDGSSWILEVSDAEGYTSEEVSNPTFRAETNEEDVKRQIDEMGFHLDAFVAVCKYLIQFAPMDSETIY